MGLLNFLGEAKSAVVGVIIISIITYCGFYVYNLKSEISEYKEIKLTLERDLSEANKTIAIKEAKIVVLESTVEELKDNLDLQNKSIDNMRVDTVKLNDTIIKLQHQEPSIQIIKRTKVIDCTELKNQIKKISGLKYEEL